MPDFEEFIRAEMAGLARYAAVLTGNRQDAHDLLADVLLAAQTRWRRIGVLGSPISYVRRMVTNRFISDRRRWAARMIRSVAPGELPELIGPDPTDAIDQRGAVAALLAALPRRQRAVVVLRFYLGLDHTEVARELGITTGSARTTLSRALAALRIAIGPDGAEARGSSYMVRETEETQ